MDVACWTPEAQAKEQVSQMNYWQHKRDGQKYRVEDILSQIESATNKVRGVLLGELSTSIYVITTWMSCPSSVSCTS